MPTIVIDPGHGGDAPIGGSSPNNATGPGGTLEKTLTLQLGMAVYNGIVNLGYTALLTRNTDVNLGLAARAAVASNVNADVFISLHFNGDASPAVQGTEVWVHSAANNDCWLLATSVLLRVVAVTGYANRGVKSKGLGVLNPAYQSPATAACLLEVSFITDPNDETRLQDPNYIGQLAGAICQAISDYINRATSNLPPPIVPVPSGDPGGDSDA